MENTLLVGLSRQMTLQREMEVVANNIANIDTNGFKADFSLFEEYLMPGARDGNFRVADSRVSFVRDRGTLIDLNQGPFQRTGNPLDVAIDGSGFLAVQTASGERYTRDGNLHLSSTGQLVTSAGDAVLGTGGPIVFQPTDHDITISPDGTVTVVEGSNRADSIRGKLRLVDFADPQAAQKQGNNLYAVADGAVAQPDTKSTIQQGSIEKSNVNAVGEMSHMVEVMRTYQQIATLVQTQSDLRKSAIEKLADVPA
jgi:flagellar basal-body rod protein FlgF